jgi:porphyrinogen peroxidase
MTQPTGTDELPLPQSILAPLTRAAIFLVVTIKRDSASVDAVRSFAADLAGIVRAVEFRDIDAGLSCITAFGSEAWDRLFGDPRPAELHTFREFRAGNRYAPATPGDILFHIRAGRLDICFELATQIMERIRPAVDIADEVQGFRYFEDRDLIGFVDGTENPRGGLALQSALVGEEDPAFAAGSYVLVQKYLHNMDAWNELSTEAQERIIGRKKMSDIELDEATKPTNAHSALTVIEENGKELKILRDNMPFGQPGRGEFGTYFIGYSRTPRVTELMLENMFVGRPPGNYDRLLDFSRAITGGLFFAPSATFLEGAGQEQPGAAALATPAVAESAVSAPPIGRDTSLQIGSLKGERNE